MINLADIKLNPEHSQKINRSYYKRLKQRIQNDPEYIRRNPIKINENNEIVEGMHKYKALQELGYKQIPDEYVLVVDKSTADFIQSTKGGHPKTELTQEQLIQVEALAAVLSKEQIADYFGISKTTFFEIEKRQPELLERYKRGKAKVIASIANSLIMQARNGNLTAAIFYLKTQAGWREVQKIDYSSEDGTMTPQIVILPAKENND